MKYYSVTDRGFFDPAIHGKNIPADAVEITDADYAALLATQAAGQLIEPDGLGQPVAVDPPAPPLAEAQARAIAQVDADAEAARLRYLTPGSGQAMVYQRKADEARACVAATAPDPADYPYLAAEIGVTADTLRGVADVVLARETAWTQASATIEGLRLAAKRDIAAAATAEEVQAVLDGVSFPAPEG